MRFCVHSLHPYTRFLPFFLRMVRLEEQVNPHGLGPLRHPRWQLPQLHDASLTHPVLPSIPSRCVPPVMFCWWS